MSNNYFDYPVYSLTSDDVRSIATAARWQYELESHPARCDFAEAPAIEISDYVEHAINEFLDEERQLQFSKLFNLTIDAAVGSPNLHPQETK